MAHRIRRLGPLGCLTIIALGCGAPGPSNANLELNAAVLAELPLPDGTDQIARTDERHDVEGRYCADVTRLTLRAPSSDPVMVISSLERELTPDGWRLQLGETSGSGDPDLFVVSFEKGAALVTVTNEGSDSGQYDLAVSHPC